MKHTLTSLLALLIMTGCAPDPLTVQEALHLPWFTSAHDKDHRIAKSLNVNGIRGCDYYRFKSLERRDDWYVSDNTGILWVQCSRDGLNWHQNLVVWPLIQKLDRLALPTEVRHYL
ncbi:hypothetical protein [Shewanella algae]|uniref:hypothetical protein n=1 Tax=Shewanella algae TaxID=38313 RepID=UPI000F4237C5|nr:hypothetical protein [Shewanella algae]AYV12974.1 hypothetical protein EEY24_08790 [Shewanella algae]